MRRPLTGEQRSDLEEAVWNGDRSSILVFTEGLDHDVESRPGDASIWVGAGEDGLYYSIDGARRQAAALLAAADHAEFGPGEWRGHDWTSEVRSS